MEALLAVVEDAALAEWLRHSRYGYAAVNAAHILGLALLVGAVTALDLKLVGAFASADDAALRTVLVPVAASGLLLAVLTGACLFAVRASEYAALPLFLAKLALILFGTLHALAVHARGGLARLSPAARRRTGALSLLTWLAVLACGRLLAFVD